MANKSKTYRYPKYLRVTKDAHRDVKKLTKDMNKYILSGPSLTVNEITEAIINIGIKRYDEVKAFLKTLRRIA